MRTTPKAIVTYYRGRRYRSRLEARWAAFFDALGWPHEYEPLDLSPLVGRGYIPDFVLRFERPLLVECKPYLLPFDADALHTCARIDKAWPGDAVLLGANHIAAAHPSTNPGIAALDDDAMFEPQHSEPPTFASASGTIEVGRIRVANARRWNPAYLAHHSDEESGYYYITDTADSIFAPYYTHALWAWSEAGNATQWKAP